MYDGQAYTDTTAEDRIVEFGSNQKVQKHYRPLWLMCKHTTASNVPQYDLNAISGEEHCRALMKRMTLVGAG